MWHCGNISLYFVFCSGIYRKSLITIIKHTEIYIVKELKCRWFIRTHMGDFVSEILAKESMVLVCGIRFQYVFRDPNSLQCLNIDYDVTWLIGGCMYWFNLMYALCMMCVYCVFSWLHYGPLTRYVQLQVAHAPGMPGTFPPAADFTGNHKLAIPAYITARAWRTCRDACRDRLHALTEKMFPAFPAHAHL